MRAFEILLGLLIASGFSSITNPLSEESMVATPVLCKLLMEETKPEKSQSRTALLFERTEERPVLTGRDMR
ncbi:MAG: hypothetical protein EOM36_07115 [Bacteroidia bacterium]|nr:hypothetical protein [Bacteroidia bacterium]